MKFENVYAPWYFRTIKSLWGILWSFLYTHSK